MNKTVLQLMRGLTKLVCVPWISELAVWSGVRSPVGTHVHNSGAPGPGTEEKEVWGVQRLYLDGYKERERKWEIAER